jgi:hypothetical protein
MTRIVSKINLNHDRNPSIDVLKKSEKDVKRILHHLIIDESTVGKDSWKKMEHLVIRHLSG